MAALSVTFRQAINHTPEAIDAEVAAGETLEVVSSTADAVSTISAPAEGLSTVVLAALADMFVTVGREPDASDDAKRFILPAGVVLSMAAAQGVRVAARLAETA